MVLLRCEDVDTVRRTLITINDRVRASLSTPDTEVILFVYYSGHADAAALHLGASRLELTELEQLVRGSAATFRVLALDACRSGALTRVKGGTTAPPFSIQLDARLAGQGMVFLTSSAANEDAQESDELKGSFFTHYFVSGLLGAADQDGDGAIVLDEAYRYAYQSTLRASSKTWAGTQHPTFRYDLRGQGKVVLTALRTNAARRATVEFPPGRSYLLLEGSASGAVVAEIGANDTSRRISVKPTRYFVRGRGRDYLLEGEIAPAAAETVVVSEQTLTRVEYARLVRKGYGASRLAYGPQAGVQLRSPLDFVTQDICTGPFVGAAIELEHVSVIARAAGCSTGDSSEWGIRRSKEVDVELRLVHTWDVPVVAFDLGVSVGGSLIHESYAAPPDESGRHDFAPERWEQTGLAGSLGVTGGLTIDLPYGFYALADLAAVTYFHQASKMTVVGGSPFFLLESDFTTTFALRPSWGLGKRF